MKSLMEVVRELGSIGAQLMSRECAHDWAEHKGRYYISPGKLTFYRRECVRCGVMEDMTDPKLFEIPEWWKQYDRKGSTVGKLKK